MERPPPSETAVVLRRIDGERYASLRRDESQPCPRCGHPMPALKGGSSSICSNCGFKDSCCY